MIKHFRLILLALAVSAATVFPQKKKQIYLPARPPIAGLHIAMSKDSAELILHKIALRQTTLHVDSLTLIESDSVRVFGEPAYLRIELLHGKVRTIVVNFHPLGGDRYLNTRDVIQRYLERFFGRGVITRDASVTYRRWENEDGTMEASFTDKYLRLFIRLGKQQWQY
ncbi:MAG TPA: hypothetical protein VEW28_07385 [Candidatus Kapabacteria bacterium]|nr:hypothetical protein [Candidatus Kapabacteria bacterium]